jgi:Uma2 family endonuclease
MTQAKLKFMSFEEYLTWSNDPENQMDGEYELIDGALVALMPESPENDAIANYLFLMLVSLGIAPRLVRPGKCEVQVPILQLGDAANRYPDLVILRPEHLNLMGKRLTITLDMPPPVMAVEVVSPTKQQRERDYIYKLAQYEAIAISEYWVVDPIAQKITVFELVAGKYTQVGEFHNNESILSPYFPTLQLTATQVLKAGD